MIINYDDLLFAQVRNKKHLKERRKSSFFFLLKNFRFLFEKRYAYREVEPVIFLMASSKFFNPALFKSYKVFLCKVNDSRYRSFSFRTQEYLLHLAYISPKMLRRVLCSQVFHQITRKLEHINVSFLICAFPELITSFLALYLKQHTNAQVITIQHGLYKPDHYKPPLFETALADYIFVWGEVYKRMYISKGISAEKIVVASPPIAKASKEKHIDMKALKPVFLGQQLYKFYESSFDKYNWFLSSLINLYEKLEIKLFYKPHPRENVKHSLTEENLSRVIILPNANVDEDFFKNYNVAYSINSTAIIHALLSNLLCFQVDLNEPSLPTLELDRFASIYRIDIKNYEKIHHEAFEVRMVLNTLDDDYLNIQENSADYNSSLALELWNKNR